MATLPPAERAAQLTQLGNDYLAQGLVPEAEHQFRSALAADQLSADAHAGLARLEKQSGYVDDARKEAEISLQLKPNVPAYLVLAQIELDAGDLPRRCRLCKPCSEACTPRYRRTGHAART